jgi:hypothetical protein
MAGMAGTWNPASSSLLASSYLAGTGEAAHELRIKVLTFPLAAAVREKDAFWYSIQSTLMAATDWLDQL